MKYYAVRCGRKPGIYKTWEECKEQVYKFSGAEYKSFEILEKAKTYLHKKNNEILPDACPERNSGTGATAGSVDFDKAKIRIIKFDYDLDHTDIYGLDTGDAFCDGSYNAFTKKYGFGGFIIDKYGIPFYFSGYGSEYQLSGMRNVAGEMFGAVYAVKAALRLGLKSINIHYDYEGIAKWATGDWKTNKPWTKAYSEKMNEYAKEIRIRFIKEAAHTGIEGNEAADVLAKQAAGIG